MNILGFGKARKSRAPDLLSIGPFKQLPRFARLTYAARCARWVEQYARGKVSGDDRALAIVAEGVGAVERYAELGGTSDGKYGIIKAVGNVHASQNEQTEQINEKNFPIILALLATQYLLGHALGTMVSGKYDWQGLKECVDVINASLKRTLEPEQFTMTNEAIKSDHELLLGEAIKHEWTDTTTIPGNFYSLRATFDLEKKTNQKKILEITPWIEERLLAFFKEHPEELRKVPPRRFEKIIAEVFSRFGFDVELTAQTRDGGRDIIAVKNNPAALKFLIECKRYVPPNKVGIGVVQRLHGVTISEGASKGIIATTSFFTAPARQHLEKHPFILQGQDYGGIVEWLRLYDMFKIATILDSRSHMGPRSDP